VTLTALASGQSTLHTAPFTDGEWRVELERPEPGLYRVRAELPGAPPEIQPVQDLFEVVVAPVT
jgi:hypothetical protein